MHTSGLAGDSLGVLDVLCIGKLEEAPKHGDFQFQRVKCYRCSGGTPTFIIKARLPYQPRGALLPLLLLCNAKPSSRFIKGVMKGA